MKSKTLVFGGTIIGGIVALFVVAAILAFSSIDPFIKGAVEEVGSKITRTTVKLDNVSTNLTAGTASLSGLTLGNPSGFFTPHAFQLGSITVKMDTRTVTKKTIVIREIIVDMPNVIAEFKNFIFDHLTASNSIRQAVKASNFATIQKNIAASLETTDSDAKKGKPRFIIEKLRMNNVQVRAVSQSGIVFDKILPSISFSVDNIGRKKGGLSPEEIASALVPKVQNAVIRAISLDLTKLATHVSKNVGSAAGGTSNANEGVADEPINSLESKSTK